VEEPAARAAHPRRQGRALREGRPRDGGRPARGPAQDWLHNRTGSDPMNPTTSTTRRSLLLGGLALLAGCDTQPRASFKGVDLSDATYTGEFRLKDAEGRDRTIADYRGKVVLLHFGFTQCPDACPTALARAAQIHSLMGKDGDRFQVLFVTLDPERDKPEMLKAY